jgi:hypothetical protein
LKLPQAEKTVAVPSPAQPKPVEQTRVKVSLKDISKPSNPISVVDQSQQIVMAPISFKDYFNRDLVEKAKKEFAHDPVCVRAFKGSKLSLQSEDNKHRRSGGPKRNSTERELLKLELTKFNLADVSFTRRTKNLLDIL